MKHSKMKTPLYMKIFFFFLHQRIALYTWKINTGWNDKIVALKKTT